MEELKLPEHFEEYAEGRKAGFLKMKAAKEQGKQVAGYFCTYTPLEVLDAAGLLSVGLCGMSNETVSAAETVLPNFHFGFSLFLRILSIPLRAIISILARNFFLCFSVLFPVHFQAHFDPKSDKKPGRKHGLKSWFFH